jgi:hypothetical protein
MINDLSVKDALMIYGNMLTTHPCLNQLVAMAQVTYKST